MNIKLLKIFVYAAVFYLMFISTFVIAAYVGGFLQIVLEAIS